MVGDFLAEHPLLALFVVLTVGTILGAVRIAGLTVGPAGALFAGLALSAAFPEVAGVVPELLGTLGLALFAYTIGLAGGPSFFSGLRRNALILAAAVGVVGGIAVVAAAVGGLFGLSPGDIAGVYAGATTNTPGLAAATTITGSNDPVVGYSLAYPFGVVGILLAIMAGARWSQRRPAAEDQDPPRPAGYLTVEVAHDDLPPLRELASIDGQQLVYSRIRRGGKQRTPTGDLTLRRGDLVTVIGPHDVLDEAVALLGRVADHDLPLDRHQVDFRRMVLSNADLAGARIADLDLGRFDAVAGFVRRGDVDLVAEPSLRVELGDRIRVVAPRDQLDAIADHLGDSERAATTADPVGFSLGLLLGLAFGVVPITIPGSTLTLGTAAAPLLVGLLLGRLGRTGPIIWQLPYATNQTLRQVGGLLFLATVGLGAGPDLVTALASGRGGQLFALGAILTTLMAVAMLFVARGLGLGAARMAGTLAGTQNQPALLHAAMERTNGDDRTSLAYALLFPPTFVAKIVCAQVLASM